MAFSIGTSRLVIDCSSKMGDKLSPDRFPLINAPREKRLQKMPNAGQWLSRFFGRDAGAMPEGAHSDDEERGDPEGLIAEYADVHVEHEGGEQDDGRQQQQTAIPNFIADIHSRQISSSSRISYLGASSQFIVWLFHEKPRLVAPEVHTELSTRETEKLKSTHVFLRFGHS